MLKSFYDALKTTLLGKGEQVLDSVCESNVIRISMSEDFSPFPAGKSPEDGENNATRFREEVLIPALASGEIVEISLDGTFGVASSFLKEAFKDFPTESPFDRAYLQTHVRIVTTDSTLEDFRLIAEKYVSGEW